MISNAILERVASFVNFLILLFFCYVSYREEFPKVQFKSRRTPNLIISYIRDVSARAEVALNDSAVRLSLSHEQISRGIVDLGSTASFAALLNRAATIQRAGTGHITLLNIGGSASAGAPPLATLEEVFSSIVGEVLQSILKVPVIVLNMAVGATATDFYAVCVSQHLSPAVDIIFTENAINDRETKWSGPGIYSPFEAAVVQQLILSILGISPNAVLIYTGIQPSGLKCDSGEDIPNLRDVYALYNVSFVSTRDLIFGSYKSRASLGCPADVGMPFNWQKMFPGPNFSGHPGSIVHDYLALLVLKVFAEHFRSLAEIKTASFFFERIPLSSPLPLLDTFPFPGVPFTCRSTLSPRYGSALFPLPSPNCDVAWDELGTPTLTGNACNGVTLNNLWDERISLEPFGFQSEFPTVENWVFIEQRRSWQERSFDTTNSTSRVRQDVKFSWEAKGAGAEISFIVRVGEIGILALGYFGGEDFSSATFMISNAFDDKYSTVVEQLMSYRHTRTAILFRDISPGWWHLRVKPHGPFSICAIATA